MEHISALGEHSQVLYPPTELLVVFTTDIQVLSPLSDRFPSRSFSHSPRSTSIFGDLLLTCRRTRGTDSLQKIGP